MYLTGVVISSNTTSADPRPCGLGPATASATAGLVASAALAAGQPVSGAISWAGLLWPASAGAGPVDAAAGEGPAARKEPWPAGGGEPLPAGGAEPLPAGGA